MRAMTAAQRRPVAAWWRLCHTVVDGPAEARALQPMRCHSSTAPKPQSLSAHRIVNERSRTRLCTLCWHWGGCVGPHPPRCRGNRDSRCVMD